MKSAFDANVSRVRPITKQEVDVEKRAPRSPESPAKTGGEVLPAPLKEPPRDVSPDDAAKRLVAHVKSRIRKRRENKPAAPEAEATQALPVAPKAANLAAVHVASDVAPPAAACIPGKEVLLLGREQVQKLREKLDTAKRGDAAAEPWETAEATKSFVGEFRSRIEALTKERDALSGVLEMTRSDLDRAVSDLASKAKALEASDALGQERMRICEELQSEVDRLVSERDQSLSRIAELKKLDEEQNAMLRQAEDALLQRDHQLQEAASRQEELYANLQAKSMEIREVASQLSERTAERDELLDRVRRLEGDVKSLKETRDALKEIKRLIHTARV
jgi:hypothetical protein